jgi:hypothetical protein
MQSQPLQMDGNRYASAVELCLNTFTPNWQKIAKLKSLLA